MFKCLKTFLFILAWMFRISLVLGILALLFHFIAYTGDSFELLDNFAEIYLYFIYPLGTLISIAIGYFYHACKDKKKEALKSDMIFNIVFFQLNLVIFFALIVMAIFADVDIFDSPREHGV
jgi:predicted membrane channel-forming protein YqfA (hemolysin III family)